MTVAAESVLSSTEGSTLQKRDAKLDQQKQF